MASMSSILFALVGLCGAAAYYKATARASKRTTKLLGPPKSVATHHIAKSLQATNAHHIQSQLDLWPEPTHPSVK
jgi:hypothetical protein